MQCLYTEMQSLSLNAHISSVHSIITVRFLILKKNIEYVHKQDGTLSKLEEWRENLKEQSVFVVIGGHTSNPRGGMCKFTVF